MAYKQRWNVWKIRKCCGEYVVVVAVNDVGFPRKIFRPVRYHHALITHNLSAFPQQGCKDGNLVTPTFEAQCEIDRHNFGAGTPSQGTICCKHAQPEILSNLSTADHELKCAIMPQ